jgi:hypothetical protein
MRTNEHFLLFAPSGEFLGEVEMHDGTCNRIVLTPAADQKWGDAVAEWKAKGIPVRFEAHEGKAETQKTTFGLRFVSLQDEECVTALRMWCQDHAVVLVQIPSRVHLECWEMLTKLPLIPSDRFQMIASIVRANTEDFITWQQFLSESFRVLQAERKKVAL